MSNSHWDLSDNEFEAQFFSCQLKPELFSHEAHLRLAWIKITKNGVQKAEEDIQSQIKSFVKHVGAEDKYHTTLTLAAIKIVNQFIQKSESGSFKDFISEFPRLKSNFKELIQSHYSSDIFISKQARLNYLEPDLLPFN